MKKILSLILVMFAVTLPVFAQESTDSSYIKRVELEVRQTQEPATPMHRAPMRINIEAYYSKASGTLDICYDGEVIGETFLYLDGNIIGYNSELNSSFQIYTPGLYKIAFIGDYWIATGYIQL